MRGADPELARLLRQYAAMLPAPAAASWQEYFRQHVAEALRDGQPSLDALARRLRMSPRTLQRRLAEDETTWRGELDAVRRQLAARIAPSAVPGDTRLASQLGYASTRSVRRARRRWADDTAPRASG